MAALSLAATWDIYQQMFAAHLAQQTRRSYLSAMNHALAELPARPTAPQVQCWMCELARRFSVPYCNLCLAVLQVVVRRVAVANGDADLGAAVLSVAPMREPVRAPRCPPFDCLDRALPAARNPAERAWLLLCFTAGLRMGELMGLKAEDWSAARMTLRIVRQRLSDSRKNKRPHTVRVQSPELARCISWTIAHRFDLISRSGWHRGRSVPFLFPWAEKRVEGFLSRVRSCFGPDRDLYMPRGVGWHVGRHWGASLLAARGATLVEIQAWLGDSSPDVAEGYINIVRGETSALTVELPGHALCEFGEIAPCRRSSGGTVLTPCLSSTLGDGLRVEWAQSLEDISHERQRLYLVASGRAK